MDFYENNVIIFFSSFSLALVQSSFKKSCFFNSKEISYLQPKNAKNYKALQNYETKRFDLKRMTVSKYQQRVNNTHIKNT